MTRRSPAAQAHTPAVVGLRRRSVLALASLLAAACTLLLFATPAFAATHVYSTSFGSGPGSGDGQLSLAALGGLAVDEATHDLYVADAGNHRVDEFSASGAFIRAFGANVGGAGVNVCTSGCLEGTAGSAPGALEEPAFIAVDNSPGPEQGDVYVGDRADSLISKFGPEGNLISAWGTGGQLGGFATGIAGIAVDPTGNLWVYENGEEHGQMHEYAPVDSLITEWNSGRGVNPVGIAVNSEGTLYVANGGGDLTQFTSSGTEIGDIPDAENPTALVADPSDNLLYVAQSGVGVGVYSSSAEQLEIFGAPHIGEAAGIAVDGSGHHVVYVADRSNDTIEVFEGVGSPIPTTGKATALTETAATLNGRVELSGGASGETTECYFEWGISTKYRNKTPCAEGQSVSTPENVHADLTGLHPGTTYHYRLVAASVGETERGEDQTFTTLGAPGREYDSQIAGFTNPWGVTVDPNNDHVWVSDPGDHGLISEYDAYPSQTLLGQQTGQGQFLSNGADYGAFVQGLAFDDLNDDLYVADLEELDVFQGLGGFVAPRSRFTARVAVAVDNSAESTRGRVYVAEESESPPAGSPGCVHAYDANRNEVDFEAIGASKFCYDFGYSGFGGPGGINAIAVDPNGNLYVVEPNRNEVDEFESSGEFVRAFTGAEVPGGGFGHLTGVAVDPTTEDVLVVDRRNDVVDEFSPSGEYLGQLTGTSSGSPFGEVPGGIAVNSNGYLYVADSVRGVVDIFTPKVILPKVTYETPTDSTPTSETVKANVDPNGGGPVTGCHVEYGTSRKYSLGSVPCSEEHFSGLTPVTATLTGLTSETTYHYRVVVSNAKGTSNGQDHTFSPHFVPNLTTEAATDLTSTSATLEGSFIGNGEPTEYYFQYGTDTGYGETTPVEDAGSPNGLKHLSTPITGLQPLITYHYRVVATNGLGTTYGEDQEFTTLGKPTIETSFSSNVAKSAAELHARINPNGADTKYRFEYGPTTNYGKVAPAPAGGEITEELFTPHAVKVSLNELQPGVTYHFRMVAENPYGTAMSVDQTFGFYPPSCPNAHLRQITNSSDLPDCRAYELVSPAYAEGTTLYPEGPNSPEATNPARFAFGGFIGAIPGSGEPPNTYGDLYVSTRTDEGWVTKYVGQPSNQSHDDNGPPEEERSNDGSIFLPLTAPGGVRTDLSMDKFIDWNDGVGGENGPHILDFTPYVRGADGSLLEEWPNVPGYEPSPVFGQSADFTHYVFQVGSSPDFSLIDNNTDTNKASEVSLTEGSGPIPIQPGDTSPDQESLQVPAVSRDGSHILMAARAGPNEHPAECGLEHYEGRYHGLNPDLCPLQASQLYMRVGDAVTYEIAPGHPVHYIDETSDGSKVFFTSDEHLTEQDLEHSGSGLYMWSENEGHPTLTLISKGEKEEPGAPGNTANCHASWTSGCGVVPFANNSYHEPNIEGYLGGNGLSDNFIAAKNGDIYFFSPEQLAGPRGIKGEENLYDYRNGALQYVASFTPQPYCREEEYLHYCSAGPVIRMQVSPEDTHMAFLTADRVTAYNNAGYTEMYTYDPSTEEVTCVSCLPDGEPPTSNVYASSNGLFMSNDGRTFFSTRDALVPRDTDGLRDVYEYTEGHAQLISSGTSIRELTSGIFSFGVNKELFTAGLVGVSADGANVYFSTYDTLVGQDRNGSQLKFYDARTDGGFPYLAPAAPCEAADECHGAGSAPEAPIHNGSGAELGATGNVSSNTSRSHHKHKKRHHKSRHRKKRQGRRS